MRIKAMLLAIAYTLVVLGIATIISGCSTGKALIDACRDGLCR